MRVDGDKICCYDGIVTVFSGYGKTAKIKRFMLTADGLEDDKHVTLEDCREMIGETGDTVTVIFESALEGEIYNFGNYGDYWWQVGRTQGYA